MPPLYVVYLFIIAAHTKYALLTSNFQNGPAHESDVPTSGFGAGVFWQIEMLVYNPKSMGNFVSLNMSFTVADIINCQLN